MSFTFPQEKRVVLPRSSVDVGLLTEEGEFSQSENWNPFGFLGLPNLPSWKAVFLIGSHCREACISFMDQALSFSKSIDSDQWLIIA